MTLDERPPTCTELWDELLDDLPGYAVLDAFRARVAYADVGADPLTSELVELLAEYSHGEVVVAYLPMFRTLAEVHA